MKQNPYKQLNKQTLKPHKLLEVHTKRELTRKVGGKQVGWPMAAVCTSIRITWIFHIFAVV